MIYKNCKFNWTDRVQLESQVTPHGNTINDSYIKVKKSYLAGHHSGENFSKWIQIILERVVGLSNSKIKAKIMLWYSLH